MRLLRYILFGLFSCIGSYLQAQEISVRGKIVDANSHEPLYGAHVFVLQAADSLVLVSDMADSKGDFVLNLPANNAALLLKTTYLGYVDSYTAIPGSTPMEIEMQPMDYAIDQVVVKASLFKVNPIVLSLT